MHQCVIMKLTYSLSVIGQEGRYIVETGETRQFLQINESPTLIAHQALTETDPVEETETQKEESNFWDRNKIKLFLTMCLENNFKNMNKDKGLLEMIAAHLATTPGECLSKYKNLRRTFIRLLKKKRVGKDIKWVHYSICEKVFSECKWLPPSVLEPWDDHKVRDLLNLYIQNLNRFRSSECLQKDVWKDIATEVGTTEYNCYHKFKNLKRAFLKWQQRSRETGKPVKWPYLQYFERIFYNYNPSMGPWNRNKTTKLMDAYIQMSDKFKNPRYQKKDLWKEIAVIVGETAANCDKKFRNLKQTYIKLRRRHDSGRTITKWRYYKHFEAIYDTSPSHHSNTGKFKSHRDDYVTQLLDFYLQNIEKFRDPRMKKKQVWRLIGPKLGLSCEGCDRKFRNLKQTYIRLVERKMLTGKKSNWPYYEHFEKIFDEPRTPRRSSHSICDVTRVVQQIQDRKDYDRFERLVTAMEESNDIQRDRNRILQALLDRK